ncbi:uncharacterized protein LOC133531984 [Cydia pomonella]|uniref:uncharacterized protein LOC133531984 n=1 Tax=Cydia pomonella TaxID=82600 RepID=UPI002ADDC77C|nr:uncharacterized protein LOC133531984 [Cydia pomonella]
MFPYRGTMSLRDAIIITVLLSQSLCEARGRGLGMSLLQGILSSNPQLAKMLSNKLTQQTCLRPYNVPVLNAAANVPVIPASPQYLAPVCQQNCQKSQFSQAKIEYPTQYVYQNVQQKEPQKEVQVQSQQTYPVSYSTVQQTTQASYPAKPNPFVSPAPMVNPFLPAASPISALCPPTSSLLPPANPTLARSHFLRKIPIPPPCL